MSNEVTIATFNAENLFTRYNFRGEKTGQKNSKGNPIYRPYTPKELAKAVKDGFIIDKNIFKSSMEPFRTLSAEAIKGVKADIVGLQEIESLDTLKKFNSGYMKSKRFKYQYLIDGNDPRFIDVGFLSNIKADFLRTHQFRRKGRSRVFSRDCIEAHFNINGKNLVVFVNHLRSMMKGRSKTKTRRETQSEEIIKILKERFGSNYGKSDFIILGDLNDYMEKDKETQSGIRKLLQNNMMINVINNLPENERWTHFYKRKKEYRQLDYILISRSLANKNPNVVPYIERRGQPLRVNQPGQPKKVKKFFNEVKGDKKASDHCPVSVTLNLKN
jgi:predicted extracellular nuclease